MTKIDRDALNELAEKIVQAFAHYRDQPDGMLHEMFLPDLEYFVGGVRMLLGVGCPRCGGVGRKSYGSTATWSGGCGGQAITEGVCDGCWGTGRNDRKGVDLRRLRSLQWEVEKLRGDAEKLTTVKSESVAATKKPKKMSIRESKRLDAIGRRVRYLEGKQEHLGTVVDAYYATTHGALRLKVHYLNNGGSWPFDPMASEVEDMLIPRMPCVVGSGLQGTQPAIPLEEWLAQQVPEVPDDDHDDDHELFKALEAERVRLGLPEPKPIKLPNTRRVHPGVYPKKERENT